MVSSVVIIKLQRARRRFLLSRLNTFRQPFVTKFGVVVHHHEPEYDAKKWDSSSSHSQGLYNPIFSLIIYFACDNLPLISVWL